MAHIKQNRDESRISTALGMTYEGRDPALLERILPLVDYIEITPDTIAEFKGDEVVLHEPTMTELRNVGADAKIIVHGVGLSIGSYDGYSQQYIRLLDMLMEKLSVAWHSEHLGYTMVDGEHIGTMLALPKTEQVLDMVCERVCQIQERYDIPFILENIVHVLPDFDGDYSDAKFLNALTDRTGCGLLLDVYNLECDSHNQDFDVHNFLAELKMERVREIHIAGGVEHRGFMLDIHSRLTRDSTVSLAQKVVVLSAGHVEVVTYELLPEAVPFLGHDAIVTELSHLTSIFKT